MSSTKYVVRLGDKVVRVSSDEISTTSQTFRTGRTKFSDIQWLKLCIGAELVSSIGRTNKGDERNLAIIAAVFKLLTTSQNVEAATEYIGTAGGKAWLKKMVVPETLSRIQEISQRQGSDSDAATALRICEMKMLVFLLTLCFLIAVSRMLPAMLN